MATVRERMRDAAKAKILERSEKGTWMFSTDEIIGIMADVAVELVEEDEKLIAEGIIAFRHTREYVGEETLPAIEGWSWFDWCAKAEERLGGSRVVWDPIAGQWEPRDATDAPV